MKRMLFLLSIAFATLILITLLFGCAELDQARVEQKYGPPAKEEILNDKIRYYYYFTWRRRLPPYEPYETCLDFTFDKDGKLINKREYLVQPDLREKRPDPQSGIRY